MGKYSDFPSHTPQLRPKSAICTEKQDDEHLHHFNMRVPRVIMNVHVCWRLHSMINKAINTLVTVYNHDKIYRCSEVEPLQIYYGISS